MASLEDVSLLNPANIAVTKEHLKTCCKPVYHPRRFKSKGALLILVWNFLCASVFHLLIHNLYKGYSSKVGVAFAVGITLLIAGWLADTCIGRYKVVRTSIWIMWIAAVLATISSIPAYVYSSQNYRHDINKTVLNVILCIMGVGLGGFVVNIIQFGLDQLHDASTTEIKSFIVWYVWTINGQGILTNYILECTREIFLLLFVCVNLSLATIFLSACNHCLIKEPIQQNSLKLVYKVIRYAIKNKCPRQRSAFTYCEDELPSRIDFGKSKYGGPFTTEQVEDVKTFLRFIPLVIVGGVLAGSIFTSDTIRDELYNQFRDASNESQVSKCYFEASFDHSTTYFGAAILIPLHETLIYPIFYRCTPRMESQRKTLVGMVALIARVLTLMAYNVISRHNSLQMNGPNVTTPCLFETSKGVLSKSFNDKWITVPDFLSTISSTMLCIGVIELISAQVPFFMKGLVIGITFCSFYVSSALWLAVSLPFIRIHSIWGTGTLSCGFWYMLLLTIVDLGIAFILATLSRWYKKRQRQDVLPNEHIFAERYYSTVN